MLIVPEEQEQKLGVGVLQESRGATRNFCEIDLLKNSRKHICAALMLDKVRQPWRATTTNCDEAQR